jgi:hypothetical protein
MTKSHFQVRNFLALRRGIVVTQQQLRSWLLQQIVGHVQQVLHPVIGFLVVILDDECREEITQGNRAFRIDNSILVGNFASPGR